MVRFVTCRNKQRQVPAALALFAGHDVCPCLGETWDGSGVCTYPNGPRLCMRCGAHH